MKLGIIAGNRNLPVLFAKSAKKNNSNIELTAICFKGETSRQIEKYVDKTCWLKVGQLNKLLGFIKQADFKKMVMVGQINPLRIFKRNDWDKSMIELVEKIEDFRPHSVFSSLIKKIESLGVEFIDSTNYMQQFLAVQGLMNNVFLSDDLKIDIDFGADMISKYVELDIGQSIVVKKKSVVALEALEGTDRCFLRGARIAGKGCVALKFCKKDQDLRFDVPVVGVKTLQILKLVKAKALVLQKNRVLILEKDKFLSLADKYNIAVVGR